MDPDLASGGALVLKPEPLTRRGYTRRPEVEKVIERALALDPAALTKAFKNRDEHAPDYFPPEALVYFIRRAVRVGLRKSVNVLFNELHNRCIARLRNTIRGFHEETRKEIVQEILTAIAKALFDPSDKADFAEASFWTFLKTERIDACRKRGGELKRPSKSLNERPVSDDDGNDDEDAPIDNLRDERLSAEQMVELKQGLSVLSPELREVFLLRHVLGLKICSNSPNDRTLSKHYGVSERTIRKWLKKAEEALKSFREK